MPVIFSVGDGHKEFCGITSHYTLKSYEYIKECLLFSVWLYIIGSVKVTVYSVLV